VAPTNPADVPYILPPTPTEIDRLDLQHYALRQIVGADYVAPVTRPRYILDVGSGAGQWGWDMCARFPEAHVVGFDLVPGKPDRPANYSVVRGNLLQGLPFASMAFDHVHQRAVMLGIPVRSWGAAVDELVRVAAPGGWVELLENDLLRSRNAPAITRLVSLYSQALRARGLDTTGLVYRTIDQWLRNAGLRDVVRHEVDLPVGEWAGYAGSLMATDVRHSSKMLCDVFVREGRVAEGEARDLVLRMQDEFETFRPAIPVVVAYGRKPA
jgi:SAM-dependent methyltransferase